MASRCTSPAPSSRTSSRRGRAAAPIGSPPGPRRRWRRGTWRSRRLSRPRVVLALGGGGFTAGPQDSALDDLVLDLVPQREPRICFLPTASGDPAEQVGRFYETFADRACRPSHLSLFRLADDPIPLAERLLAQDVIYVGGGSMRNLLAIWRAHQLDTLLAACWRRGIALAGLSAGAMCWFAAGITRSRGSAEPIGVLGLLDGS